MPIPALAEVQVALEEAVAEVTQLKGYELKRIMRTGTVASTDNRNWELLPSRHALSTPERRFSQSRAIALDMESATIAANGFRFRVPYGTLLCVSDKPLHGEIKLPGMASLYSPVHPQVFDSPAATPWVSTAALERDGMLYVVDEDDTLPAGVQPPKVFNLVLDEQVHKLAKTIRFAVKLPAALCG